LPPAQPPSGARRPLFLALQLLLAGVVLWYAGRTLASYWTDFDRQPLRVAPQWSWVIASGAVFLGAHALLVQTWRAVLGAWSAPVRFWTAASIWSVSSLARYVPGKLWQIGAMSALAHREGVSPVAATGSAVLGTLVNLAAGFAVVLATGWSLLGLASPGVRRAALIILAIAALALLVAPWVIGPALRLVERATGRRLDVGALPLRAILYAAAGNLAAWVLYGLAFQLLARGVLGSAPGGAHTYIAVYTLSYLVGYIVLVVPGGLGVREGVMIEMMPVVGLADPGQAAVLAVASRLWLTILEILPGLVFMALAARSRPPRDAARQ
jgi:glycosyltransferase 2 family protein